MPTLKDVGGVLFIMVILLISSIIENPENVDGMTDGVTDKIKDFIRWVNSL